MHHSAFQSLFHIFISEVSFIYFSVKSEFFIEISFEFIETLQIGSVYSIFPFSYSTFLKGTAMCPNCLPCVVDQFILLFL